MTENTAPTLSLVSAHTPPPAASSTEAEASASVSTARTVSTPLPLRSPGGAPGQATPGSVKRQEEHCSPVVSPSPPVVSPSPPVVSPSPPVPSLRGANSVRAVRGSSGSGATHRNESAVACPTPLSPQPGAVEAQEEVVKMRSHDNSPAALHHHAVASTAAVPTAAGAVEPPSPCNRSHLDVISAGSRSSSAIRPPSCAKRLSTTPLRSSSGWGGRATARDAASISEETHSSRATPLSLQEAQQRCAMDPTAVVGTNIMDAAITTPPADAHCSRPTASNEKYAGSVDGDPSRAMPRCAAAAAASQQRTPPPPLRLDTTTLTTVCNATPACVAPTPVPTVGDAIATCLPAVVGDPLMGSALAEVPQSPREAGTVRTPAASEDAGWLEDDAPEAAIDGHRRSADACCITEGPTALPADAATHAVRSVHRRVGVGSVGVTEGRGASLPPPSVHVPSVPSSEVPSSSTGESGASQVASPRLPSPVAISAPPEVPPPLPTSSTDGRRNNKPPAVCPLSVGHPRLRPFPALTCSGCAYTVCVACFRKHVPEADAAPMVDGPTDIRCHVCRQPHGLLTYDAVPPFTWTCESYLPSRMALKDGGMYAQVAVQRYYQIRDVREARRRVPAKAASVVWVGSEAPSVSANAAPVRPNCVVEGGSFRIALSNPSVSLPLVWCARTHVARREIFAAPTGEHEDQVTDTVVPLCVWHAPPTLKGFDLWTYQVNVPRGFSSRTQGSSVLELRHWRVGDAASSAIGGGDGAVQPPLFHHGSASAPTTELDASPMFSISVLHNDLRFGAEVPTTSSTATVPFEARFAVDALVHGRSVGVVGVGSKHSFLEYVAHSAELRACGLHRIDALSLSCSTRSRPAEVVGGRSERLQEALAQLEAAVGVAQRARLRRRVASVAAGDGSGPATVCADEHNAQRQVSVRSHHAALARRAGSTDARRTVTVVDLTTTQDDHDDRTNSNAEQAGTSIRLQAVWQDATLASSMQPPQLTPFRMTTLTSSVDSPFGSPSDPPPPAPSPPPKLGWDNALFAEQQDYEAAHHATRDRKRRRDPNDDEDLVGGDDKAVRGADGGGHADAEAVGLQSDVHPSLSGARHNTMSLQQGCDGAWAAPERLCNRRGWRLPPAQAGTRSFPYAVPQALLQRAQRNHTAMDRWLPQSKRGDASVGQDGPHRSSRSTALHQVYSAATSEVDFELLLIHNIDALWSAATSETSFARAGGGGGGANDAMRALCSALRRMAALEGPQPCIRVLFSFEDVDFLSVAPRELLDCLEPQLVHLQSPLWLMPRLHELEATDWHRAPRANVPMRLALCAAIGATGGTGSQGGGGAAAAGRRRGLPLSDTVRRVVTSLPHAFRQLLSLVLRKQAEVGEDVYMPVPMLLEAFQTEAGLFVSHGRMRPFLQELTSNRLGLYEPSKHALLILQHTLVTEVLTEVTTSAEDAVAANDSAAPLGN